MKLYEIHAPLGLETVADPEGARAARTGFSVAALILGPLWLLARGLWPALLIYALFAAAVVALDMTGVLRLGAAAGLLALAHLYLGFEGRAIRAATRERAGRPPVDVVFAGSALEAEKIYLDRVLRSSPPHPRREAANGGTDVIGLFPEPGR